MFAVIMLLAVLSSCNKLERDSESISFVPQFLPPSTWITTQNSAQATKGAPALTSNDFDFMVSAYTSSNSTYINDKLVEYTSDDIWSTSSLYFWPGTNSLFFSAYSPVDLLTSSSYTFEFEDDSKNMEFEYTVASAATAQPDIVLASFNAAQGKNTSTLVDRMVPLKFYHALSAIKFVASNITPDFVKVKSISINNIYTTGSCVFSGTAFTWSDWDDTDDVSQTYNKSIAASAQDSDGRVDITEDQTKIFMLIPQTVSTGAELEIVFEDYNGDDVTLTADMPVTWVAGHVYKYIISCSRDAIKVVTVKVDPYLDGEAGELTFE